MDTLTLTPSQAAVIAKKVYGIKGLSVSEAALRGSLLGCEDMFTVNDKSRVEGKSGGLWAFKQVSGFGYIAAGKGVYQGHILIATRGTTLTAYDWATNLNVGTAFGPSGTAVHAGFYETWKSLESEISHFLRGRNPTVVHCVGHSLGGALATLSAEYVDSLGAGAAKLYTFGCPRTGTGAFARSMERRLGANNIHRVFNIADPVPMIPVFPFVHTPVNSPGVQVGSHTALPVTPGAHDRDLYVSLVGSQDWNALSRDSKHVVSDNDVKIWLTGVQTGVTIITPMGAGTLAMLGHALQFLLKLTLSVLGGLITAGFTIVDELALMLYRGAQIIGEVSMYVLSLVNAIMRFLGRATVKGASLTLEFISWAMGTLYRRLSTVAFSALNAIQ